MNRVPLVDTRPDTSEHRVAMTVANGPSDIESQFAALSAAEVLERLRLEAAENQQLKGNRFLRTFTVFLSVVLLQILKL